MKKEDFVLWAAYNKTVNSKMDEAIKALSPEEWERPLGGYFKSVRGLCSHLYICDFAWLKRLSKQREFTVFKEPFFGREPYSFSEVLFEDRNQYLTERPVLDDKMVSFAGELNDSDIQGSLKYTDSHGRAYEKNFGGLFMQSLVHDCHHRGMISLCLELLGKDNDFASFGAVL